MFLLFLWVSCIPASRTTAPPCGVNIPSVHLRLVHIIVFEKPVVGGLQSQFLLGSIKAREDQERPSAMFHHVQSVLNVYSTRGSESQHEKLKLKLLSRESRSVPHLSWLGSQGGEVSGRWWRCHSLKQPQVHEPPLPPDLSSLSHLSHIIEEQLSVSYLWNILPSTDQKSAGVTSYRKRPPSR